jgi:hypothetical protein
VVGIEVKSPATVNLADFRWLAWLRDKIGDQFVAGIVAYAGGILLIRGSLDCCADLIDLADRSPMTWISGSPAGQRDRAGLIRC